VASEDSTVKQCQISDGCELVEVTHENDDGENTEDGSGVLPNRSNPVSLLIDGDQHGETDHADLIDEQTLSSSTSRRTTQSFAPSAGPGKEPSLRPTWTP